MLEIDQIYNMDCIKGMKQLEENSIDAIITDPPYGLEFMGKDWDKFKNGKNIAGGTTGIDTPFGRSKPLPSSHQYELEDKKAFQQFTMEWAIEALRVLKPGGHLLAFGGTRTYHRMACAVEDAGFEIRDQIQWLYGSGFPKSLNVGKAIDKMGAKDVSWFGKWLRKWRHEKGISSNDIGKLFPSKTGGLTGCVRNWELGLNIPTPKQFTKICRTFDLPFESIEEAEREIIGNHKFGASSIYGSEIYNDRKDSKTIDITLPSTPEAKQWGGWGTALKPANEPIVVARKPLSEKNVALNVLKWGTGAINIDDCRIGCNLKKEDLARGRKTSEGIAIWGNTKKTKHLNPNQQGRFPANIILDEEAGAMLDEQSGESKSIAGVRRNHNKGHDGWGGGTLRTGDLYSCHNDKGGASRFFYCAKANKSERNEGLECFKTATPMEMTGRKEGSDGLLRKRKDGTIGENPYAGKSAEAKNNHPTVKPIKLMAYLIKLVTPPDGIVLDPFIGSGTTAIAAYKEHMHFIGFEKEKEYYKIANARIKHYYDQKRII